MKYNRVNFSTGEPKLFRCKCTNDENVPGVIPVLDIKRIGERDDYSRY